MPSIDLQKQWQAVEAAPMLYGGAIVVVGLVIWAFLHFIFKSRLESLQRDVQSEQNEVGRLRARLAEFDAKLKGATPEEVRTRIDGLEEIVRSLRPRTVTDDQRRAMVEVLRRCHGRVEIATDMGAADARGFAAGLAAAFAEAGWQLSNPMFMGLLRDLRHGLGIAVQPSGPRTPSELLVLDAFKAAGIEYDISMGRLKAVEYDIPEVVELFISNPTLS